MNPAQIVRHALQAVLGGHSDQQTIEQYFAPTYLQWADGQSLDYSAFLQHLEMLGQRTRTMQLQIDQMISEGNQVFSLHQVKVEKPDGSQAHYRILALFTLQEGRIIRCEELTHMLQGQESDRDMGSR